MSATTRPVRHAGRRSRGPARPPEAFCRQNRNSYLRGCHCDPCRDAAREYSSDLARLTKASSPRRLVPATKVRAHILALSAAGMKIPTLAKAAGCSTAGLRRIATGEFQTVTMQTARKVLSVREPEPAFAPKLLLVRRMRALSAIGWSVHALAQQSGMSRDSLSEAMSMAYPTCTRAKYERYVELYDALHMTPGPSEHVRRCAKARGWLPPLAWEEDLIDCLEPYAEVAARALAGMPPVAPIPPDVLVDVVHRLAQADMSDRQIANALRVKSTRVTRILTDAAERDAISDAP